MAFIEYLLDNFKDSNAFELLCTQIMLKEGYSKINPIGGIGDKGRDAEDILYCGNEGKRSIIFQFSLEKTISSKVIKTLRRIHEAKVSASEVIFIFSTNAKTGERDKLKEKALMDYGLNIDIRGQRYLAVRLANKAYRDVAETFFAKEISQMKALYDSGQLFAPDTTVPEKEKRCLVNLMHCGRHPMAGDIKELIIREAVRRVLAGCGEKYVDLKKIKQMVFDYLPAATATKQEDVYKQVNSLRDKEEIEVDGQKYRLTKKQRQIVEMDIAEILAGRRGLIDRILIGCGNETVKTVGQSKIIKAIDEFLSNLFRKHGLEVVNEILNSEGSLETALSQDSIDSILSIVLTNWAPVHANRFREAIKSLISRPQSSALEYMNALSNSYICMQLLNADPESINVQRKRIKESVAVLDTDVVLTGIIHGARRERVSKAIAEMCSKRNMTCFAFNGSVEEIVFRIKKSIALYEDIGCPTMIPLDKKMFVSDIFLDQFFNELANGEIRSFDEFIQDYYDLVEPASHIGRLIEERLSIPIEPMRKHYIIQQDNKVDRIRNTIEKSRVDALSFKNPIMYRRDALAMVIVEQQNREMIGNNNLGRWYLVSEDKHILNAYLSNKGSFKIKPSILPIYFLELLRQCPEWRADEETFGAILESEGMLRGVGRNYTPIISAIARLGVKALSLPNERLVELIDIMDRADFTQWLLKLRAESEVQPQLAEEIREALEKVIKESRSRSETIKRLEEIKKEKSET